MLLLTQKELRYFTNLINLVLSGSTDRTLENLLNHDEDQKPGIRELFKRFMGDEEIKII